MHFNMKRIFTIATLLLMSSWCYSQFTYTFVSLPDSAEVKMNGETKCYTPCKVKYYWREKVDGQIRFELSYKGYENEVFTVPEKPTDFDEFERVNFKAAYPSLKLENTPLIAFDKIRIDFTDGKKIGEKRYLKKSSTDIKWEGSIKVGDERFEESFYEIVTNMGFNTMVSKSTELFSEDKSERIQLPRFIIGAEIEDIKLNYQESEGKSYGDGKMKGKTEVLFNWQVLDKKTEKVALSLKKKATINFRQSTYQQLSYLLEVYNLALVEFLTDQKFVELLKSGEAIFEEDLESESKGEAIVISAIKSEKYSSKSEMIKSSKDACVTISTDGGHGSGALISKDGMILTAYHVIEGVNKIEVIFDNGLKLPAELIKHDAFNDVALVKIPGDGYHALPLYDGSDYSLGTEVVTIGTPYDLDLGQSVSNGMLSGKRKNEGHVFLQLDMAVSPGNSGGPLLNTQGEIVGVVQRKIVDTGIEGIGFAIPTDKLKESLNLKVR